MSLLLDTNVLSEWQKTQAAEAVVRFGEEIKHQNTMISVISVAEFGYGVARLPLGRKRTELELWLANVENEYSGRILAIELETARVWANLVARLRGSGRNITEADAWIAATAIQHGLQLATRNVRDFAETGVPLINPWDF
ncbi:MAG TPA: type II toxin-antitoxin system VapC family toxin [Thermomicrobiales bacterium]|nr:type II toxin-antitoxin system VapC family toxin [Thermomicrobiales bacterium]